MNADEIINKLNKEFLGKAVIPNTQNNPTEIICEIDPSTLHPEFSVAVAYIKESVPHRHIKAVETYEVENGVLDLYLDGIKTSLSKDQSTTINPGVIHWAKGDWTRVKVTSKPGWVFEDHITVNKAVSAGGVIIKDGKMLLVKFPNGKATFPKGHVEDGETYEQAAIREVEEETGLSGVKVIKNLGVVTRPAQEKDGEIVIKDIHLFHMETENIFEGSKDEETGWFTKGEAMQILLPQEADFFRKLSL